MKSSRPAFTSSAGRPPRILGVHAGSHSFKFNAIAIAANNSAPVQRYHSRTAGPRPEWTARGVGNARPEIVGQKIRVMMPELLLGVRVHPSRNWQSNDWQKSQMSVWRLQRGIGR